MALPPLPSRRGRFGENLGFLYETWIMMIGAISIWCFHLFLVVGYDHEGNSRFDFVIYSSDKGRWTRSDVMSPRVLNTQRSYKTSIIACGRMLYTLNYMERCYT